MVGDDRSDILSGDKLPVGRYQPPSYWSTLSGATKVSLYFVTFLLIAFSVRTFHHRFLRWRETNYRKATRRRHGIPDTDNRPFNVAYAAAVTARKENEARKNLQLRQRTLEEASPAPSPTRRSFGLDARQITSVPGGLGSYPIRSPSVAGRVRSSLGPTYGQQSHLHPINALTGRQDNISASSNRSNRSTPRKTSRPQTSSPVVHPQPLDDEGENSAVEVVEQPAEESFSEGAPQSDEDHQMEVEGGSIVPARGAKRLASPDDEDEFDDTFVTQRRDKRARKISREHPPIPEDDVMVDADADIMDESHTSPRGKKRDRGDAASTFGGDEDSLIDDSDDKHKRNRRRRTVSTRKPRGQKRGRESHAFESGSDEEVEFSSTRGSRKKRGKKAVAQEDTSFFEPPYSTDPLCKGRRVGEEWEIGGTKYKVGPNGDRLQQALVKRKRPKYKMPSDSQHPDKDVMIEVVVEAWLTEDEYKLAKERFELAWQDPPPNVDIEMETPSEPQTPVKGGKALLWASTTSHADSPLPERRPFRHSITTNVGLPLPTSPQLRTPGKGRISTPVYSPAAVGLDSPRLKHVKSFSKWEKQDMEAEAMLKIRQKLQESKKVVEDEKKPSPAPTLVTTSTTTTVAQSLTTPAPATPMQPKPATSTPTVTETKEPAKNLFTTPTPVPTPSTTVPAPAQPAIPNFFAKPTTTTPPAPATKPEPPATTTSTTVPNFFSKSAVPPPSATTSTPVSAFSIPTTQPTPTAGTSTTKPMFTFPGLGNAGSGPSPFSVPKPAEQPKQPQPTATLTPVPNVPSLGARLGPQVTNAPTPVPTTTKPASTLSTAAATTTTSAPEPPKPADNTPKFTFGFKPAPTPATSSTPTTTPVQQTTTTAVPQFGKTGQSQPALSPFGTTGQPQSTPSPFGTTGQSQPAPSPFGTTGQSQLTPSPFGTTNHSQSTSSPFGTTGQLQHTPSPFGTTRQSQQPPSLPENASQSKPTPSPFGTSNQSKSAPSPFGANNQTQPAPSPFGITNQSQPTPSPFGATSQSQPAPSPFGATSQPTPPVSGTQPAPPKPASQPTQPSFNFPTNKPPGASDPRVTFPSTTPATTGTPPSVFSFPPSKLDTSKPGPSPLRNGSVFGATPTPTSAFPMTTSTSTTLPTPVPATDKPTFSFNFPNTPNTTTANETIGSKASPFVFTPVTPSTSTGGGAPSPFNFSGIAQGQNGTTPAAFGFGAPNPGAFSFGKPEEKK